MFFLNSVNSSVTISLASGILIPCTLHLFIVLLVSLILFSVFSNLLLRLSLDLFWTVSQLRSPFLYPDLTAIEPIY